MPKSKRSAGAHKKSPRRKPAARRTPVKVPIDRALRSAWQAQLGRLEGASHEGAGAFDERYESAAAILEHNPPLYLAGGCATFRDFCQKFMHEDERSVRRNMRVAKYATPSHEERFGVSKIDAALNFIDAKLGHPVIGKLPVDFTALKFDVGTGSDKRRIGFDEATTQQIQEAARALARKSGSTRKTSSPVVLAFAKVLSGKTLGGVSVRVSGEHVFLGRVPIARVSDLARALLKLKLPAPA